MDRIIREEARLIILRALSEQADERLNSELLRATLETFGIARPRAWVHGELDYLAEMGAVTITEAGTVRVAQLTELGARHLTRNVAIEGVKRPSRPEA
ncbi:hypothetical protein [Kaustia mangrovi]